MPIQLAIQSPGTKPGPCTGKKFLVTGGARGLGKAIVEELYQQGAVIYALSRNPDNLKALKEEFPSVTTICVDLEDCEETKKALEDLEPMDCLINNAAVAIGGSFWELTPEIYDKLYRTNLRSVLTVSQIIAKKMVDNGKGGAIVNVSSIAGKTPYPFVTGYSTLKAALEMLTKTMAIDLGPFKITVNSVCPAAMETDMLRDVMKMDEENKSKNGNGIPNLGIKNPDEFLSYVENKTPTKTWRMPISEAVQAILFFGSKVTTQITGESLLVDGGLSIAF